MQDVGIGAQGAASPFENSCTYIVTTLEPVHEHMLDEHMLGMARDWGSGLRARIHKMHNPFAGTLYSGNVLKKTSNP